MLYFALMLYGADFMDVSKVGIGWVGLTGDRWWGQRIYIFIFFKTMEAYEITVDIIILNLANPANKSLAESIIKFLDAQDLRRVSMELQKSEEHNSFTQLIRTYYFLTSYLNKIDRTFYFPLYESPQFQTIQAAHIRLLANHNSNCFLQFPSQYTKCLAFISSIFPEEVQATELATEIERMITDTDIPMPKLKRENQGIFCRTAFQNYLVYLRFKNECFVDYEEIFQGLSIYFESMDEIYLDKLFMKAAKDKHLNRKIRFLRFTPYQITFENHESYLIPHNSLHNFLVSIFTLTDIWLTSTLCYLASIEDPFHRYVQLITRYSVYRNYVISVEENLAFAFEQYGQLYTEVFMNDKPMYRFWRPAMTKWMIKFEKFHSECSSIFFYCLTKLRTKSALNSLEQKEQEQPEIYISVKNKLAMREHEIQVTQTLLPQRVCNGMETFFEQDEDQYQSIMIEYMEYMVDLSINEETVHWCGHSQQVLSQPYASFEKYVLAENKMYVNYVRDLVTDLKEKPKFLKYYYEEDLSYLQTLEFKPVTLKKLTQIYSLQLCDSPLLSPELIQPNSGLAWEQLKICYDSTESDKTLQYFNTKSHIQFEVPAQSLYFYSITPLITSDELLAKSISTVCSQGFEDDQDIDEEEDSNCDMEYFSKSSEVEGYEQHDRKEEMEMVNWDLNRKTSSICGKSLNESIGGCDSKTAFRRTFQYQIQANPLQIKRIHSRQPVKQNRTSQMTNSVKKWEQSPKKSNISLTFSTTKPTTVILSPVYKNKQSVKYFPQKSHEMHIMQGQQVIIGQQAECYEQVDILVSGDEQSCQCQESGNNT